MFENRSAIALSLPSVLALVDRNIVLKSNRSDVVSGKVLYSYPFSFDTRFVDSFDHQ